MTGEPRRCVATASSTGERCRKAPVRGATVCATHGGSVGRVKAAAARRVAESAALAVWQRHNGDGPAPVDVVAELARLAAEITAFKDWAGDQLAALSAGDWAAMDPATAARVALFERSLDRAGRLLTDLARLGLDSRTRFGLDLRALSQRAVAPAATATDLDELRARVGKALRELGHDPENEHVRAVLWWAIGRGGQGQPPPKPPGLERDRPWEPGESYRVVTGADVARTARNLAALDQWRAAVQQWRASYD
jgi:hypothetical protein